MACDAQTLVTNAASKGLAKLSCRELKEATLYAICAGPLVGATAQSLITAAASMGYQKLSDRELDEAILSALCP